MKKISIAVILALCFSNLAKASGAISVEFVVCRELEISLGFQLDEEKRLPASWNDFELVRAIKKGTLKHQLYSAKAINSFALVPGAPVIKPQIGIPYGYPGYRLVFISRKEDMSKSSGTGRCALLADPGGENSKQFKVYAVFFPENLAQIILKQIDGFDPHKQPLAFEDLSPFEREEQQFRDNIRIPNAKLPSKEARDNMKERPRGDEPISTSSDHAKPAKETNSVFGWIIGGLLAILTLVVFSWLKFRK